MIKTGSICVGKEDYTNPTKFWEYRTRVALMNRAAQAYDYDVGNHTDPAVAWVKEKIGQHHRPMVLEIGCGFGRWARVLAMSYSSYVGVDPVKLRIEHAMLLTPKYTYNCASFMHEPNSNFNLHLWFNAILCITVIQHVLLPEAEQIMRTIERHLDVGGKAYLAEGRLWDIDFEEACRRYDDDCCAAHMIPKPISALKEAAPNLQWENEGGGKFTLTKVAQ